MKLFVELKANVREFFWLEGTQRRWEETPPETRAYVSEHLLAARRRLRLVPRFVDASTAPVALPTARDAIILLVRARHAWQEKSPSASADGALDTARELAHWFGEDASAPNGWRNMLPALESTDLLAVDRLALEEQQSLLATFLGTAKWLERRIDITSTAKLWATRTWRMAAAFALVVSPAFLSTRGPNLALHKTAMQSSFWEHAAPPSVLVDGLSSARRGPGMVNTNIAHTDLEESPWLMVDLGVVHPLGQVRIYNRADMRFDGSLPCFLEISSDGTTFEVIAERAEHFGSSWLDDPWVVDIRAGKMARFVRVRGTRYLALSEIEVFGR